MVGEPLTPYMLWSTWTRIHPPKAYKKNTLNTLPYVIAGPWDFLGLGDFPDLENGGFWEILGTKSGTNYLQLEESEGG